MKYPTPSIVVSLRKDTNKKSPLICTVRIKYTYDRQVKYIKIGARVHRDDWCYETERVKAKTKSANAINELIETELANIYSAMSELRRQKKSLHIDNVLTEINLMTQKVNMDEIWLNFMRESNTLDSVKAIRTQIKNWEKLRNKKLYLDGMNDTWLSDYIDCCINGSISVQNTKMKNSSIRGNINLIIRFLKYCRSMKYLSHEPWISFPEIFKRKCKKPVTKKKPYLNPEQIDALYALTGLNEKERTCLDMWLFAYECGGLRRGDVFSLKLSDFEVIDGKLFVRKMMGKTKRRTNILMNERSIDIYKKYRGNRLGGLLFHNRPHEETVVKWMKEFCRQAGFDKMIQQTYSRGKETLVEEKPLWQLVCFHTARVSKATNMIIEAVRKDEQIDKNYIQFILGHTSVTTTERYIRETEEIFMNAQVRRAS